MRALLVAALLCLGFASNTAAQSTPSQAPATPGDPTGAVRDSVTTKAQAPATRADLIGAVIDSATAQPIQGVEIDVTKDLRWSK